MQLRLLFVQLCDCVRDCVFEHFDRKCGFMCHLGIPLIGVGSLAMCSTNHLIIFYDKSGPFFPLVLGGEPFLVQRGKFLGELVKYCKSDLQMESVSIVSNGSLIAEVRCNTESKQQLRKS